MPAMTDRITPAELAEIKTAANEIYQIAAREGYSFAGRAMALRDKILYIAKKLVSDRDALKTEVEAQAAEIEKLRREKETAVKYIPHTCETCRHMDNRPPAYSVYVDPGRGHRKDITLASAGRGRSDGEAD